MQNSKKIIRQVLHDLNSPLTAVETVFQVSKNRLDKEAQDLATKALDRIRQITQTVMAESKSNYDASAFSDEPEIKKTLIQICREQAFLALKERKLFVTNGLYELSEDLKLKACPVELGRCISNLLTNARESTEPGHLVQMKVKSTQKYISICIKDHGRGFLESQLLKLKNWRKEKGLKIESTKPHGHGLGIQWTLQYLEKIEGDLQIRNNLDGGASVLIKVPILTVETKGVADVSTRPFHEFEDSDLLPSFQ